MPAADPDGRRPASGQRAEDRHDQAADPGAGNKSSASLSDFVILMVDAIEFASEFRVQRYPAELALAFADGSIASWLVEPEVSWVDLDDDGGCAPSGAPDVSRVPGKGLPAPVVAAELAELLAGRRVYCDLPRHAAWWLNALFESSGVVPRFSVGHLKELYQLCAFTPRKYDDAWRTVCRIHRSVPRAANSVLRHREMLSLLARDKAPPDLGA
jgi:hypothetical protein